MNLNPSVENRLAYQVMLIIVLYGASLFSFIYGHHHAIDLLLKISFFMLILATVGLVTTLFNILQIKIKQLYSNR